MRSCLQLLLRLQNPAFLWFIEAVVREGWRMKDMAWRGEPYGTADVAEDGFDRMEMQISGFKDAQYLIRRIRATD
jgi:hypothetical protein